MAFEIKDNIDDNYKSNCCGYDMTTDFKKPPSGRCMDCGDACWGIIPEIEVDEDKKEYERTEVESLMD